VHRSFTLSALRARLAMWGLAGAASLILVVLVSWGFLTARAAQTLVLQGEIDRLQAELAQVDELVARLEAIEAQYGQIQDLFGAGLPSQDDLWLPLGEASERVAAEDGEENPAPVLWPLTERGFITRTLLEGAGEHPGLDVAVPEGSYIRASGPGQVAETGTDPVYGRFLRIEHAGDVETLYAHASMILVRPGDSVRAGEVIGMTGSTGRSTAPHLHFEIRVAGVSVDPLTIVVRP
jgi:murein DD-endopeptidase MepM/ murein hydrolase activator NlpD